MKDNFLNEGRKKMKKENLEKVMEFVDWFNGLNEEERKEIKGEVIKSLRIRKEGDGRKEEVRRLFESRDEGWSIREIGEELGISDKNVSSILSYLRKEGIKFNVNWDGRRVMVKD